MKKENPQNAQQEAGGIKNKAVSRNEQENETTTNVLNDQQKDISHQSGLGRDRMAYIEDLENIKAKENYGDTDEDLKNENLNAANDQ